MITLKQYNFCRKIGLPPIPHVERYFAAAEVKQPSNWGKKAASHMRQAGGEMQAVASPMLGALSGAILSQMKYNHDKTKLQREGKDTKHLKRGRYLFNGTMAGGAIGLGLGALTAADAENRERAYRESLDQQPPKRGRPRKS